MEAAASTQTPVQLQGFKVKGRQREKHWSQAEILETWYPGTVGRFLYFPTPSGVGGEEEVLTCEPRCPL